MSASPSATVAPTVQSDAPAGVVAVAVAHARRVPSAAREAYAAALAQLDGNEAVVVLHTCHRVEAYVALDTVGELRLPDPPPGAVRLKGVTAARHLISTACGLDSAVLGEDQILHQIRRTLVARRAAGPLDATLDRLFQMALQAGRRAHDWFGGEQRSLGDVAFDEIESRVGPLDGRPILVVGAGSMGRLAAVAARRRGARPVVTNRSPERAAALAADVGGETIPWGVDGVLPDVAGVIVALAGPWPVSPSHVRQLREHGAPVVDLSSPPAVPGGLVADLGARFVSVDDLAWGADTALPDGLRARLEDLVWETGQHYCRWLRARESRPAIRAMTETAERRRRAELEWLLRRLPNVSPDEAALIDRMSQRLVGGMLHAPLSALRLDDTGDLCLAARELFGLGTAEF